MSKANLERESSFTINTGLECNRNSSQFGLLDEEESENGDVQVPEFSATPTAAIQLDPEVEALSTSSGGSSR